MILAQNDSNTNRKILLTIQEELFVLGSDLATPLPKKGAIDRLQESQVKRLEILIDKLEHDLPPLRSEEHTSELQSRGHLVCRLLPEKKKDAPSQSPRTRLARVAPGCPAAPGCGP